MRIRRYRDTLEELYLELNHREYVKPDPLQFLYDYEKPQDREIVGLIASSLALGRVAQIIASVKRVLSVIGSPIEYVSNCSQQGLRRDFADFRHRFVKGSDLSILLAGIRAVLENFGSLNRCFVSFLDRDSGDTHLALNGFVNEILTAGRGFMQSNGDSQNNRLLPIPERGSASKRLNLYLRWMVRCDSVDPGGWQGVKPSQLIVPVDTHIHRIAARLGLTNRVAADHRTAVEITDAFRKICPHDPVKYDFVLTRLGIRNDTDLDGFLERCGAVEGRSVALA